MLQKQTGNVVFNFDVFDDQSKLLIKKWIKYREEKTIENNYCKIPNEIITDNTISSGAFRLYVYLLSKPSDYPIINKEIKTQLNIKQSQTLANYFKELINSGWIKREKILNSKNQFDSGYRYIINRSICQL